jgi:hypothetical protein
MMDRFGMIDRFGIWLALLCLAAACFAFTDVNAADKPAETPRIEIGRSSQVIVDMQPAEDVALLRFRRTSDQSLVDTKDVTATVDDKPQTLKLRPDGYYTIPMDDLQGTGDRTVELTFTHDGFREILTGKVPAIDKQSTAAGLLGDHKQLAWWILNALILLAGVWALSRRKQY